MSLTLNDVFKRSLFVFKVKSFIAFNRHFRSQSSYPYLTVIIIDRQKRPIAP